MAGVAPSFTFQRIKSKESATYLSPRERVRYRGPRITINLKNLDEGIYFLPLAKGLYQIREVAAPFYNLPYLLNTSGERAWRFSIVPSKINYIGELTIDKERGLDFANITLRNRIATNKQKIDKVLEKLPGKFNLRVGSGVRDDFLEDLLRQEAKAFTQ